MTMSVEGYAWLLLRACGCSQQQLIQLLQPTNLRFPNTEAEFEAMQIQMRRIGHVLENSHRNLAASLCTMNRGAHAYFGSMGDQSQAPQDRPDDPWLIQDPWAQGSGQGQAAPSYGSVQ